MTSGNNLNSFKAINLFSIIIRVVAIKIRLEMKEKTIHLELLLTMHMINRYKHLIINLRVKAIMSNTMEAVIRSIKTKVNLEGL
jgi:hypothetical protein